MAPGRTRAGATGNFEAKFDAGGLASGVYLYRLRTGLFVQTRKVIVVKQYLLIIGNSSHPLQRLA